MKKNKDTEKVQLALDEHKWINTPVVYTKVGSECTSLQQNILLLVSGKLQTYIKDFLDEHRNDEKDWPKPIFSKEILSKGIPPIRIPLTATGVAENHYKELQEMLNALSDLWVKAPSFDKDTGMRNGQNWYPIFKRIFIPDSTTSQVGTPYEYKTKDGNKDSKRRMPYIEAYINDEVAAYVFDMSKGYINHIERFPLYCNSAFTSRIYLLLMPYLSRRDMHPRIPYFELKDFLGMIVRPKKSDEIIGEKYEKFSKFRTFVLDVAVKDMERLAADNKTEFTFTYDIIYTDDHKRGNPDFIQFHIKRTPLGIAHEADMKLTPSQRAVQEEQNKAATEKQQRAAAHEQEQKTAADAQSRFAQALAQCVLPDYVTMFTFISMDDKECVCRVPSETYWNIFCEAHKDKDVLGDMQRLLGVRLKVTKLL